jgi:hypothetical protein
MGLQPIPPAWCSAVCAAIRRGPAHARFTNDGHRDWQRAFPSCWRYELEQAFIKVLSATIILGCPVTMDTPPGETWEFFFELQGEKAYGKILLRTDRQNVVIFSAHRPRRSKLRCE